MKLSSDAMTVVVGLLNDLCTMQRKVEAGQGADCTVDLSEGLDGMVRVGFAATIDTRFTLKPAEHFPGEALLRQQPVSHVLPSEGTPIRNGRSTYPSTGSSEADFKSDEERRAWNADVAEKWTV